MNYKSGFVALVGSSNVGKSTLMNALIGMKVAIVSHKAQTTRNKVVGILTRPEYQVVFLDTPGIHTPRNLLGNYMVKTAYQAAREVDVTLMVIDGKVGILERDESIISELNNEYFLVAINKTDAIDDGRIASLKEKLSSLGIPEENICAISALNGTGLENLEEKIVHLLEPGPMYYPEDMVSDRPMRFIAGELIREKALLNLSDEIPHGVGVEIEKVDETDELVSVYAVIYCERASHKGIIIGKQGKMMKKIASDARRDLEMLFGTKVYLEIWVKVKEDWRNSNHMLKTLGYRDEE